MSIRVMTINDYDAVFALWESIEGMGMRSIDDSKEGIAFYLMRNPETSFVAEENGEVVGTILCGHDGRRGYIYHTAVREDIRGRSIAKALLDAALTALQKEGINKAALVVFESNKLGNGFWERMGFSKRDDLVYRNLSLNKENY